MSATLESVRNRVKEALMDPLNLIWKESALDEAVRLALAEYNLALGSACTLQGMDGAVETTLPEDHTGILVLGASACAASARAVNRLESFQPEGSVHTDLGGWASQRSSEFRQALEQLRLGGLKSAGNPPWAETGWKLDAWDGE